ncbi:hypothetical protein [Ktedonospora formicarum]|uniref:Uncharacterized protein n=1 Tax=Ktedonospora formicarum TaxID=2778364 RepID=A0A8J3MSZ6_9CHLR|nr:hypothetical protein [Ktedonospora formicarum]GHO45356.1 hypothetical protein KSX_35190 [Ktedonospora formicarum]
MRIENLSYNNAQSQGPERREWFRTHSAEHLERCESLMQLALRRRPASTASSVVVLGAGNCTEVPLVTLNRGTDELVLADLDLAGMRRACDLQLPNLGQRRRMRLVECDLTGGVSRNLERLIRRQRWDKLAPQGASAIFDAAASCLEECEVPDPPVLDDLGQGQFGVVISSLVMSQLFSYPILDVLDPIIVAAPDFWGEQERHRRYQEAAQAFRLRVINAHLHLLGSLVDQDGLIVLLSDVRGFAFNVYGTDHDASHRRDIPLVPRAFFDLVKEQFTIAEEQHWEWLTDLPEKEHFGRGYEVVGYVLRAK